MSEKHVALGGSLKAEKESATRNLEHAADINGSGAMVDSLLWM